jgi:hypothetical protein
MIRRVASRGLAQSRPARGYAPAAPVSPASDRIAGTRARSVQVSGKNIMPDEIIDELNLSWEGKHDRWAGYGPVSPKPAPSTGCRPADPSLPAAATLPGARTHARSSASAWMWFLSHGRCCIGDCRTLASCCRPHQVRSGAVHRSDSAPREDREEAARAEDEANRQRVHPPPSAASTD